MRLGSSSQSMVQWGFHPAPLCSWPPYEFQLEQSSASPGALYLSPWECSWGPLHEGQSGFPQLGHQEGGNSHRPATSCRAAAAATCGTPVPLARCLPSTIQAASVGPVGGRNSCLPQVSSPPAARMGLSKLKITHILRGEVLAPATCPLPPPSLTCPVPLRFSPLSSQAQGPPFARTMAPGFGTVFASLRGW